jgi:hypothetical protein
MSGEDEALCLLVSLKEQMFRISAAKTAEISTRLAWDATRTVERCLILIGGTAPSLSGGAT